MNGLGLALTKNYKVGGSVALAALIAGGGFGLALASADDSMAIVDAGTPANDYQGTPGAKLTTTRASGATYWDANGVLQTAGNNVLRRDFDPRLSATAERCGYLIEEARTNLALRSEEFDNASWSKTDVTITANSITAPDGATTADLQTDGSAGTSAVTQTCNVTVASPITFSIFAKVGNSDWLFVQLGGSGTERIRGWFNLSTGAAGTPAVVAPGASASATITSVGNGWYRCTLTGTLNGAGSTCALVLTTMSADQGLTRVNGATRYLWGAQLEQASFASSYIPTAGSTVTRAADLVTLAGTLFPLNQTEGTLYSKFMCMGLSSVNQYGVSLNNDSGSEIMGIARDTGRKANFFVTDSSVNQVNILSSGTISDLTQAKVAAAYKLNDCAAAQIGETVVSDIVCTMPTTTQMVFGNLSSGSPIRATNGWLFEVAYFPTRKTNSQLQALASGYASDALLLMGAETQGLTFSASDQSMSILDTGTPANTYSGELSAKLGSIRTSAGMTYLSSGLLGWGPENLLLQSQTLGTTWTQTATTVTSDAIAAPDGTVTADKIVGNTSSTSHFINQVCALADGVFSVYLKAGELNKALLFLNGAAKGRGFDLVAGVTSAVTGVTATATYGIEDAGNGWYRCWVKDTTVTTSSVRIYLLDDFTGFSFAGANTTDGLYAWGAQAERSVTTPSTYKPTTSAAYYGLRLDYDSRLTGGPGYLVEEARTNLAIRSQELDNAAWTKLDTTITANDTAAPDGTTTADLCTEGTGGSALVSQASLTISANTTVAVSAYFKRGNTNWLRFILFETAASANRITVWVNTSTGALGTVASGGTASGASATVQTAANGFFRVMLVGAINNSATAVTLGMSSADADNSLTRVNNATYYAWGAQLEAGAFATSYIPTTSATVTRAADAAKIATTAYPNNTAAATFYARFTQISVASATYGIMSFDSNSRALYTTSGNVTRIFDGTAFASAGGTISALTKYKLASCYGAVGGLQITRDGATVGTAAYDGSFGTQTNLNLGESASAYLNGWLHEGRYFLGEKSAAQLQALAA